MTGEELYQRMKASLSEWLADCPPRERHWYTADLIGRFCAEVAARATPDFARDFEEAMKRHGY